MGCNQAIQPLMKGQTNRRILEPRLQRRLRKSMTDAERRLWRSLQRRQLGGLKFRRQHPFGDYVIDFVCLEAKLAVEVDGGQHADGKVGDAARTNFLERAGFRVLRFWNHEVLRDTESVVEVILGILVGPTPPPSPPFPLRGKGDIRASLLQDRGRRGPASLRYGLQLLIGSASAS